MLTKDFHKPTHVSALEVVREIYSHCDRSDCMLKLQGTIENCDGIAKVTDPNFINRDVPLVWAALYVLQDYSSSPR